ncbi:hypothetical protein D3C84_1217230 [compost metagenome]
MAVAHDVEQGVADPWTTAQVRQALSGELASCLAVVIQSQQHGLQGLALPVQVILFV